MRGVRPREIPVDPKGRPYVQCHWRTQPLMDDTECGEFFLTPRDIWEHVIAAHLGIMKDDADNYKVDPDASRRYNCHWGNCKHFTATSGESSPYVVSSHIQTHLPDTSAKASARQKFNKNPEEAANTAQETTRKWLNTQEDERHDPAGLPLASVLVLRNLARQLAKVEAQSEAKLGQEMMIKMGGGHGHHKVEHETLVAKIFAPVKEQLYFVMAHNLTLRDYIASLTKAVAAGRG